MFPHTWEKGSGGIERIDVLVASYIVQLTSHSAASNNLKLVPTRPSIPMNTKNLFIVLFATVATMHSSLTEAVKGKNLGSGPSHNGNKLGDNAPNLHTQHWHFVD